MRLLSAVFALAFALLPLNALAVDLIPSLQTPVEIQAVPDVPEGGGTVTLYAQNVTDKSSQSYTWTVNGTVVAEGVGVDRTSVTVGDVGQVTAVRLQVSGANGNLIADVSKTIIPAGLDLVWEGNTYVPPLSIERPLPTGDSTVTVQAVPDVRVGGTRIAADELVYTWYLNGAQTPYRSGYGLDHVTLAPPLFDSAFSVTVVAETRTGSASVRNSVTIVPVSPEITFYEKSPLLGTLFNRAVSDQFVLLGDEVTLRLFPFFVVDPTVPSYTWKVDGSEVDPGDIARELTLRKTGAGSGQFSISASFESAKQLFEQAKANVLLTF